MTAGIEVYNDNGYLQITDTYKNLQFLRKYTVTIPQDKYWTFVEIDPTKVLAVRAESGYVYTETPYAEDESDIYVLNILAPHGTVITIYEFGYQDIPSGNHFEVRNADGALVFSDGGKWMKVLEGKSGAQPAYTVEGQLIASTLHSSSVKTAVVVGMLAYTLSSATNSIYYQVAQFESLQTTTIYRKDLTAWGHVSDYVNTFYSYLVIDVTGL
ncbi:hypothetical protein [Pelosinus propionicus]|uniref:Uncharacterized protein n=1 Tax=Pelosinus propionicus DSM 13327 TaxID=1123291 RepID=A0A1I4N083_9FIRM|nr:hypothetical protein [Pelosinus propionicus]SFM08994.1 hypothetical protein SAMN04490355_10409 [Pelosinus propionicus DSM 13327]